jgi:hypothetical protein
MIKLKSKLHKNVSFCTTCVLSNQKLITHIETSHHSKQIKKTINFGKKNVCDACRWTSIKKKEIDWHREYYQVLSLRLTLDTKINYRVYKKSKSPLIDDTFIMEVKLNNIDNNNYIDESFAFMETRFPKYCEGIESLNLV